MKLFTDISEWLVASKNDWCKPVKAHALAAAILTLRPAIVVEIGVFRGGSFIPMAMAVREVGRGLAIAIDPWSAQASVEGQAGANKEWWASVNHDVVAKEFVEQVALLSLGEFVQVVRKRSDDAIVPAKIDILHVDGNHGEQAVKDVERFAPNVRVGGMVFMDDIGWDGGAVGRACERLLGMGFIKLYDMDTGAMFQRVGVGK